MQANDMTDQVDAIQRGVALITAWRVDSRASDEGKRRLSDPASLGAAGGYLDDGVHPLQLVLDVTTAAGIMLDHVERLVGLDPAELLRLVADRAEQLRSMTTEDGGS